VKENLSFVALADGVEEIRKRVFQEMELCAERRVFESEKQLVPFLVFFMDARAGSAG